MPKILPEKILKLKGKTTVFIDWANVYNWKDSLKKEIDPQKLYKYLRSYDKIGKIRFYFGEDKHKKSKKFLKDVAGVSYELITKPVKYIFLTEIERQKIYRRKCDFDMEICIDVHKALRKDIDGFIFFTGDGDFEPLYKLLIKSKKQVIVVYAKGHIGREIWNLKKGLFKIQVTHLGL